MAFHDVASNFRQALGHVLGGAALLQTPVCLCGERDEKQAERHDTLPGRQGLTLVHFSAQPVPFLTHNTP
jgi:hypothetical protein